MTICDFIVLHCSEVRAIRSSYIFEIILLLHGHMDTSSKNLVLYPLFPYFFIPVRAEKFMRFLNSPHYLVMFHITN